LVCSRELAWVERAVWFGDPFVLVGDTNALDRYLERLDEVSAATLFDCAYFWILTDSDAYRHRRLPEDRVVALDWKSSHQNVLHERIALLSSFPRLKGLSRRTHYIREELLRIAGGPIGPGYSVLILGDSGVGKEEVAQSLFERGSRYHPGGEAGRSMHCVGGAWLNLEPGMALTELIGLATDRVQKGVSYPGLLKLYSEGALFIDDFESAPRSIQETLLRIMSVPRGESASYMQVGGTKKEQTNVWLMFATNSGVEKMIQTERLREDFFYRFEDRILVIKPLRDRPADFPAIARAIWSRLWQKVRDEHAPLTSDDLKSLAARKLQWEGNIRTLRALLALVASMKMNPAHNSSSVGSLIDQVLHRGNTYQEWVGIVETDFFAAGRTPQFQLSDADRSHIRCYGPSSPNYESDPIRAESSRTAERHWLDCIQRTRDEGPSHKAQDRC
jgi:DNA-binding NtrC family response regulator